MKITHLGHACLLVETGDARILIDPGTMSSGFEELRDLDAVLVTHQHFDHFNAATVGPLLEVNPEATLVLEEATVDQVPDSVDGTRTRVVSPGDTFDVAGVEVQAVGGQHAVIHPDLPVVPNVGFYFTESGLLHPGDAYWSPTVDVKLLALPTSGPWQSLADTVDYLREVDPPAAFPIHEGTLAHPSIWYTYLDKLKPAATTFQVLEPGKPAEF